MKTIDRFEFIDHNRFMGICKLEINEELKCAWVTELADNPGMSITNCIELVGEQICLQFNIRHSQLILVECYTPEVYRQSLTHFQHQRHLDHGEPMDATLVTFSDAMSDKRLRNPQWQPLRSEAYFRIRELLEGKEVHHG